MTTSIKIRTNGNYVAEAKNTGGTIIGRAGPGNNVESEWISVPHDGFTVAERTATEDEVAAANAPKTGEGEQSE